MPHRVKELIKSPGMSKQMYNYGFYRHKYQTLWSNEKTFLIILVVLGFLYIMGIFNKIGNLAHILVFIAGVLSIIVVLAPIMMLFLRRRINKRIDKISEILKEHHSQRYVDRCQQIGIKMYSDRKAKKHEK